MPDPTPWRWRIRGAQGQSELHKPLLQETKIRVVHDVTLHQRSSCL